MTALPLPSAARPRGRRAATGPGLAARAGGLAAGVKQIGGRIGVRLALLQALILVTAFALAGYVGRLSTTAIAEAAVREQVAGEAASMRAEYVQKGAAHLPHTIDKRTRLWRGFEYRLTAGDGRDLAGTLPSIGGELGWSRLDERGDGGRRAFLAYSTRLPDGSTLTVGQDLEPVRAQVRAMGAALIWCGGLGVAAGLIASVLLLGGAWRRLSAVLQTAGEVSRGRLDARVGPRPGGARDEIDELGAALDAMLDKVGELMEQVRQVSTAVAHDLRTPLTRVGQRLDRLRRLGPGAPMQAAIEEIDAELQGLLRSFDAMLRLAEIENGAAAAEAVDLADIAARVAEAYRPDIEEDGRALETSTASAPVFGDGQLISQALANLLDNALRHTPSGVPIRIRTELRGDGAALVVADSGPGVPAAQRAGVLQRFRRLDPSRSGQGSGLGLAIVAAIAERHGAALVLDDARPGLRVELLFPRAA
jgi:signal transduction histidine kinase